MGGQDEEDIFGGPVELPVDGVLDLHAFNPRDVEDLLPHYLSLCRQKGIFQVRVIHGKGSGQLREKVHSILRRNPEVASFCLAAEGAGGWGATIVTLKRPGRA
ncbi:MAG: Smr/MutS family protein [Nitrospiraceae bacterium]|nr:Smr/MutS family protein [Nitrospiraceae bacterium]